MFDENSTSFRKSGWTLSIVTRAGDNLPDFIYLEPTEISPDGVKLVADKRVELNTELNLVFINPEDNDRREIRGWVFRVEEIDELVTDRIDKKYGIGIRFEKTIFDKSELS